MAYSVEQRTAEAGIRTALRAQPSQVLAALVRPGVVAIAAGLAVARTVTGLLASLLYGTTPGDPLAYGAAAAVLIPVVLAACWIPARQILRLDPLSALRWE